MTVGVDGGGKGQIEGGDLPSVNNHTGGPNTSPVFDFGHLLGVIRRCHAFSMKP